jgi:hypothetical protein
MRKLQQLQDEGSGISQLQKKQRVLGTLLRIPETVGNIVAPWATAMIPGTELHHQMLLGSQRGTVSNDIANDERTAQGQEASARANAISNPQPKEPTTAFELWHQQNPQGTVQDWQKTQQKEGNQINSPQEGYARAITEAISENRDPLTDPHVLAWKAAIENIAKEKEPNRDDRAIQIMSKPEAQWTPEERAYMTGYKQYVQMNKVQPGVSRMEVANDPKWEALKIQKQRMVAPYVEKAMEASKIDDLAERIMRDVRARGGQITGPEFMQLLSYHIAGTLGSIKGGNTGEAMIHEHINARPWSEALQAMYNKAVNGGNVSMKQAEEWAKLASDRRKVFVDQAHQANELYGAGLDENKMPSGSSQFTPPPNSRPVIVKGQTIGYTTDGKTMIPVTQ